MLVFLVTLAFASFEYQISECVICNDAFPDILFQPCRHICLCASCNNKERVETCPYCRKEISSREHKKDPETDEECVQYILNRFAQDCPNAFTYRPLQKSDFETRVRQEVNMFDKYNLKVPGTKRIMLLYESVLDSELHDIISVVQKKDRNFKKKHEWLENRFSDFVGAMNDCHEKFSDDFRARNPVEKSIGFFQKYMSWLRDQEMNEKNSFEIRFFPEKWQNDFLQKYHVETLSREKSTIKKHLLQLYQEKCAFDMETNAPA